MNPATEYRRLQVEVRTIIERMPDVLNAHVSRQEATPQYWSHVADLKHARLELLRVAAFLGDLEAKETLLGEGGPR